MPFHPLNGIPTRLKISSSVETRVGEEETGEEPESSQQESQETPHSIAHQRVHVILPPHRESVPALLNGVSDYNTRHTRD